MISSRLFCCDNHTNIMERGCGKPGRRQLTACNYYFYFEVITHTYSSSAVTVRITPGNPKSGNRHHNNFIIIISGAVVSTHQTKGVSAVGCTLVSPDAHWFLQSYTIVRITGSSHDNDNHNDRRTSTAALKHSLN